MNFWLNSALECQVDMSIPMIRNGRKTCLDILKILVAFTKRKLDCEKDLSYFKHNLFQ